MGNHLPVGGPELWASSTWPYTRDKSLLVGQQNKWLPTDQPMDGQTDGQTDGRTDSVVEMRGSI